jgi:hypothetical protein
VEAITGVAGHAVGLDPLGPMLALLAGLDVASLLGGLFAVPVAGVASSVAGSTFLTSCRPNRHASLGARPGGRRRW